jgi:hypothetical protein
MPGYDEETVRKSREEPASDDPDRVARRMDRGPSPDAGATESLGIRPDAPIDEKPGRAEHQADEELVEGR